jgi:predicted small metal-binding protein
VCCVSIAAKETILIDKNDSFLHMKTLSCRDAGCDCNYIAKGETEEQVMRDAAEHGMKEHGKTEEDMTQMKDNLKKVIRTA